MLVPIVWGMGFESLMSWTKHGCAILAVLIMQIKQEDVFDFMYMLFKRDSYKTGIFRQAYCCRNEAFLRILLNCYEVLQMQWWDGIHLVMGDSVYVSCVWNKPVSNRLVY